MKIHVKPLVGVMLLAALLVVSNGPVAAQSSPAVPAPGGSFAQRLEQRKAERVIQLGERDLQRLSGRCIAAQGDVRSIQQKTGPILANRTKVYQRIDAKLWVSIGQLKLADKDTFELEKQRLALAEKAAAFQTIATLYQQALDDTIVINCQADVVGFKALLDTARLYQAQVRTQSSDIRAYVVDQIKPKLAGYATELQPKPATEGEH